MKLQPTTRSGKGFTLTELLVVICVVAVVAVLLLPALAASKRKSSKIGCVNNLKQISIGFRIWEGDNGDKYPMQVSVTNGGAMELAVAGDVAGIFRTMSNELSTPKFLICPQDTKRIVATDFAAGFSNANISYFLSLDASDPYPNMILAGDDNLAVNGIRVLPGILNLLTNASVGWTKERHGGVGYIALADGSVAQTPFNINFETAGMTNRLVIP